MARDESNIVDPTTLLQWHYWHLLNSTDRLEFINKSNLLLKNLGSIGQKDERSSLVKKFLIDWHISNEDDLTRYLVYGKIPPEHDNYGHKYPSFRNVPFLIALDGISKNGFNVWISPSVKRSDILQLWLQLEEKIKELDLSKEPVHHKPTRKKTEITYNMWKMLKEGKTWSEVCKVIDEKYNKSYKADIRSAKNFLKNNSDYREYF
jgi:hypothetical protein